MNNNGFWRVQMDIPKDHKDFHLQSEKSKTERKKKKKKNKKMNNLPKRVENPMEMLKYFVSHTSLHGIRYGLDENLYRVERIIWILLVIVGSYSAIKVIHQLYGNYEAKKTQIFIDDLNHDIFHTSFPSVTICPSSRMDWNEVLKIAGSLVPSTNEKATRIFFKILTDMSILKKFTLDTLNTTVDEAELEILSKINISDVMLQVLPKCENIIFNCSWSYVDVNCCEIFHLQRTRFGFCYAFNSLTSVYGNLQKARKAHAYGIRSGLRLKIKSNIELSPFLPDKFNHAMFIISDSKAMYPSKVRYLAFGMRYNVDLKFTSAYSSEEVMRLETEDKPPCKYENGSYQFVNCLATCEQKYIERLCDCVPTFLYPIIDEKSRECNIQDFQCLARVNKEINEVHFTLANEKPHIIKSMCHCPQECEYSNYDDYVIGIPYYESDSILLDVHYDGPTGVRYKRVIEVTNLDMLVQLGGIFGLFLGGSILTIIEFVYCLIVGLIFFIYMSLLGNKRKKKDKNTRNTINVEPRNESRIYPLLDFPPPVMNTNKLKF